MRILFLSDQDLVRGPMTVQLARAHARQMQVQGVEFSSAGISASADGKPDTEFLSYMRFQQLDVRLHRSTPFSHRVACESEIILTMTHGIARRADAMLGPPHSVKIRVLNDLIGFGDTEAEMDLLPPSVLSSGKLLTLFSRIKASTGRFVRNISHGCDTPEHFGIPEVPPDAGHSSASNSEARRHLANRVFELLGRAFEPMTLEMIHEALNSLGMQASPILLAEILERDLDGRVTRTLGGAWEPVPTESGGNAANGRHRFTPHRADVRFTVEEAFQFLALHRTTSLEDAKRTYRKLVSRYHPDKFHDDADFHALAEIKARRMNKAWEIVEKELKRR